MGARMRVSPLSIRKSGLGLGFFPSGPSRGHAPAGKSRPGNNPASRAAPPRRPGKEKHLPCLVNPTRVQNIRCEMMILLIGKAPLVPGAQGTDLVSYQSQLPAPSSIARRNNDATCRSLGAPTAPTRSRPMRRAIEIVMLSPANWASSLAASSTPASGPPAISYTRSSNTATLLSSY